jgi:hypothetical protein
MGRSAEWRLQRKEGREIEWGRNSESERLRGRPTGMSRSGLNVTRTYHRAGRTSTNNRPGLAVAGWALWPAPDARSPAKSGVPGRRSFLQAQFGAIWHYTAARWAYHEIKPPPESQPTVQSEPGPKCSGLLPKRLIAAKSFSMQDRWLPGARQGPLWQPESFIMERTSATG